MLKEAQPKPRGVNASLVLGARFMMISLIPKNLVIFHPFSVLFLSSEMGKHNLGRLMMKSVNCIYQPYFKPSFNCDCLFLFVSVA